MKRLVLFLMIFLSVSSVCFAVTKTINIQGGYDAVSSINVNPIPSQPESYRIGMPFSLDDPTVRYSDKTRGRQIATWNVLANYQMLIDVKAELLHSYTESGKDKYDNGLGYILEFTYSLSYIKDEVVQFFPELSFKIEVKDEDKAVVPFTGIDLLRKQTVDPNTLVGSADGNVYFMFDKNTTDTILSVPDKYNALPNGNYLAKVTFYLRPVK